MQRSGYGGGGGSNMPEDRDLLKGVMAGETSSAVYPENRCLECEHEFEATGKVIPLERCWHRHWRVADASSADEVR